MKYGKNDLEISCSCIIQTTVGNGDIIHWQTLCLFSCVMAVVLQWSQLFLKLSHLFRWISKLQQTRMSHVSPLLRSLHWLLVSQRIDFKVAVLTYKIRSTSPLVFLTLCCRTTSVNPGRLVVGISTSSTRTTNCLLQSRLQCRCTNCMEQSVCWHY